MPILSLRTIEDRNVIKRGEIKNIDTTVEEGDLLIFPAHILHMAPPHYDTDELRVIFSFNFS